MCSFNTSKLCSMTLQTCLARVLDSDSLHDVPCQNIHKCLLFINSGKKIAYWQCQILTQTACSIHNGLIAYESVIRRELTAVIEPYNKDTSSATFCCLYYFGWSDVYCWRFVQEFVLNIYNFFKKLNVQTYTNITYKLLEFFQCYFSQNLPLMCFNTMLNT